MNDEITINFINCIKYIMNNFKKLLFLSIVFFTISFSAVYFLSKHKNIFYVRIQAPFVENKLSTEFQSFYLGENLRLNELVELDYIDNYIANTEEKYDSQENYDKFISLLSTLSLVKDKNEDDTGAGSQPNSFILSFKGISTLEKVYIKEQLTLFSNYLKVKLSEEINKIKKSIIKEIDMINLNFSKDKEIIDINQKNKIDFLKTTNDEHLISWKDTLFFNMTKRAELHDQMTTYEFEILESDIDNAYFLMKRDFLYEKIYALEKEISQLNDNIKNHEIIFKNKLNKLNKEYSLSMLKSEEQKRLKIASYQKLLNSIQDAHVSFFIKNSHSKAEIYFKIFFCLSLSILLSLMIVYIYNTVRHIQLSK